MTSYKPPLGHTIPLQAANKSIRREELRRRGVIKMLLLASMAFALCVGAEPIERSSVNSKVFYQDDQPVYLIGDGWYGPHRAPGYDMTTYVGRLAQDKINFTRVLLFVLTTDGIAAGVTEAPWLRTGPGTDSGGQLKFDLNQWSAAFFTQLRQFLSLCAVEGITVEISIFEGWSLKNGEGAWDLHPFNGNSNINGIDPDTNSDGYGFEFHTLREAAVTTLQEALIRKVVDETNEFDNLIYEIGNETNNSSFLQSEEALWLAHMVDVLHTYELSKPKQHLIAVNADFTTHDAANDSNVDVLNYHLGTWVPSEIFSHYDTTRALPKPDVYDETIPIPGPSVEAFRQALWATFIAGGSMNVLDWTFNSITGGTPEGAGGESIRATLRYLAEFVSRVGLEQLQEASSLAGAGWCAADAGEEYVVFLPGGGSVNVDLSDAVGTLPVEWYDPATGAIQPDASVVGGAVRSFTSPLSGDSVLHIGQSAPASGISNWWDY